MLEGVARHMEVACCRGRTGRHSPAAFRAGTPPRPLGIAGGPGSQRLGRCGARSAPEPGRAPPQLRFRWPGLLRRSPPPRCRGRPGPAGSSWPNGQASQPTRPGLPKSLPQPRTKAGRPLPCASLTLRAWRPARFRCLSSPLRGSTLRGFSPPPCRPRCANASGAKGTRSASTAPWSPPLAATGAA